MKITWEEEITVVVGQQQLIQTYNSGYTIIRTSKFMLFNLNPHQFGGHCSLLWWYHADCSRKYLGRTFQYQISCNYHTNFVQNWTCCWWLTSFCSSSGRASVSRVIQKLCGAIFAVIRERSSFAASLKRFSPYSLWNSRYFPEKEHKAEFSHSDVLKLSRRFCACSSSVHKQQ